MLGGLRNPCKNSYEATYSNDPYAHCRLTKRQNAYCDSKDCNDDESSAHD